MKFLFYSILFMEVTLHGCEDFSPRLCLLIPHLFLVALFPRLQRIPEDLVRKIEKKDFTWERFYDMTPQEIGELVRVSEAGW